MKEIEYSQTALKALKSMPQDRSERIRKKITAYAPIQPRKKTT